MADTLRPMRLGVLLGADPLKRWEVDAIRQALAVPGVELVAVLSDAANGGRTGPASIPFGEGLFHRFARSIKTAATEFDNFNPPASAISLAIVTGEQARVEKLDLDVLLDFTFGHPDRTFHSLPKFGTWRFASEDGTSPNEVLPGLREFLLGIAVSGFSLVNEASGGVIAAGHFGDHLRASVLVDEILTYAARWPATALGEIRRTGALHEFPPAPDPDPIPIPKSMTMIGYHWSRILGGKEHHNGRGGEGDWNIGILHQPIHTLLDLENSVNVRWLPSPSTGKSRSEPFGYVAGDGELNVLYRKSENHSGASVIARLRPKPDNVLKRSRTMLALADDHAYPYVVEIEGTVHMLRAEPEAGRTEMHQLNADNEGFEFRAVLLDRALHAATLFPYDGRWWLMGTRDGLEDEGLSVYYADSPLGPFTAHAMDPVKIDVRSARPAGTPFVHEGVLWRPAFDASIGDNPGVVLNKVLLLTPDEFQEEPGRRIDGFSATSYGRGVRTICAMGDVTLVDGLRSPILSASKANASRSSKRRSAKQKSK